MSTRTTDSGRLARHKRWNRASRAPGTVDATGDVIGGLVGRTSLGVLFVDYFHVPDSLRGQGIGARALELAEQTAAGRGCAMSFLFTLAVQAPGFYAKQGYEEFGRVACEPPGNARVFMRKKLEPAVT